MISVLGAGAFGTALATALGARGPVTLWGRDMGWWPRNPRLPGVEIPAGVTPTDDLDRAAQADTILLALPAQALGGFLAQHGAALAGKRLVNTAKGIDMQRLTGPSALIADACPEATVALLTGPSFAADIARGLPTALTLACADADAGAALQAQLSTPVLRLYRTTDVTGAELGGALKNVAAIAAGAVIGAGLGDSARAAIITRGFAEMTRLATHLGARPETLTGLSGLGDLTLTCTSAQSRNFRFGQALGAGAEFDAATTVEGAATAQALVRMAQRDGLDLPIATMVARLAQGLVSVEKAMDHLLSRPLKEE
ncbi:NAD(P)H-dependent glycerol-3-phosphate dehydrogenase [Paracoccus sp. 1_MG-2023]|uniref:NAD(P)H-dependent glycerol-3-phosphate dehydrogenase n=1 Tax=unclassified Paracoccus (in: a-proteobacteria) TaxID=2688777 RepID=UPI001C0940FF|nr:MULTISPECIES: NAD(P)H-dependent glycerol-3-phosphate dehydrogenase [unclassified Paracoccus (in: a-proteobacteria)]MBU2957120.1 NAD(P)H-dependent glycerol-3-phosphate dehydrogenase [Paracoccus sp. C2R09]MDO6669546.1 NAD(P)H-dependent glycerol-3-phosphate dehydrogenase [Paracoccus sp. 1_MG-2023]